MLSGILLGLGATLQEAINQIKELQSNLAKCTEITTGMGEESEGTKITGVTGKVKSSTGEIGIVGGAIGGAGGGIGVVNHNKGILGGVESTSAGKEKLGPGATGGALGGSTTGRAELSE